MTKNIMIVGVGGQGSLLASRIIGNAALSAGYDVKVSEVHGMAQRGGSVVTYVRYGEKVESPVICEGEADVILSFEIMEAARWLSYLKKGGRLITSTQMINPMPVITGACEYPEELVEKIKALGVDLTAVDAVTLAEEAGSAKAANVVLIGAMAKACDFTKDELYDAMESCVPKKLLAINEKAFDLGYRS